MTSRPVLVLFEYPTVNGGERSFLAVAPGLLRAGWNMVAAVPSDSPIESACREAGIETVANPLQSGNAKPDISVRRERLAALISRLNPELIHANSLAMARLVGPVAQHQSVPSIGYLRDIIRLSRRAARDTAANDRLVAVSRATRQYHVEQGIPSNRVDVIYNGIDTHQFQPRSATFRLHDRLGISRECHIVLCIGQIGLRKAPDVVLRAFQRMVEQHPDRHLVFIGERNSGKAESQQFEAELKAAANQGPCRGHVHFAGRQEDIHQLMNDAALLLHAARQEPLGRVLLEASASALPWVATNVGGTREIIGHPEAFDPLVSVDDDREMARKAMLLLQQPTLAERLGQYARQRMAACFSVDACLESLERLYREVAKNRSNCGPKNLRPEDDR